MKCEYGRELKKEQPSAFRQTFLTLTRSLYRKGLNIFFFIQLQRSSSLNNTHFQRKLPRASVPLQNIDFTSAPICQQVPYIRLQNVVKVMQVCTARRRRAFFVKSPKIPLCRMQKQKAYLLGTLTECTMMERTTSPLALSSLGSWWDSCSANLQFHLITFAIKPKNVRFSGFIKTTHNIITF